MVSRLERAESIRDKAEEFAGFAQEAAEALATAKDEDERERLRSEFQRFREAYSSLSELAIQTLKK